MGLRAVLVLGILSISALALASDEKESSGGLSLNFYRDTCPQAEDIIREQVKLLYKRHKNTVFSWLRNIFHDCAVESCDASLLLDSTRRVMSEKEVDRSFGLRNFRYLESIKEAVEREGPEVVSCSDILVLSTRDAILQLGGPFIPLKIGRRDGRRSRANVLEQYLPDHNESVSVVLDRFKAIGIDTPGLVALLDKEVTQALENLKKLQQDSSVQNKEIDTPLHTPRKRRRFSLEAMDSGPVQVVSSEPRIQSCPSPINSAGRCNSLFQIVVESLTGMEVSSSSQYDGMALCALHQSSGYSFELISVKKGAADEPGLETQFLLYQPSSLGTFERVAPDWMRESIVFSLSMCPVFFKRVFHVIKLG